MPDASSPDTDRAAADAAASAPERKTRSAGDGWWRYRAWTVGMAALAAVVVVALWLRPGPPAKALPTYTQTWSAQSVGDAGPSTSPDGRRLVTLSTRARFDFVARPDAPVKTPVVARAALRAGGLLRIWDVPIEVSPDGAVRLGGVASERFPASNATYDVVLVIRAGPSIPDDTLLEWAAAPNRANSERGVRVMQTTVRVVPAGS